MKKLLLLLLFPFSFLVSLCAQDDLYPEMLGVERAIKLYETKYKVELELIRKKALSLEKEGDTNFSSIVRIFNEEYSKFTYPFKLAKDADATAVIRMINLAEAGGVMDYLCKIEEIRASEFLDYLFSPRANLYEDIGGSERVNKIYQNMYSPIIHEAEEGIRKAENGGDDSNHVRQINIFFKRLVGHELQQKSSTKVKLSYIEVGKSALRVKMLKKEKERLAYLNEKLKNDFINDLNTLLENE